MFCLWFLVLMGVDGPTCPIFYGQWPTNNVSVFVGCISGATLDQCPTADAGMTSDGFTSQVLTLDGSASTAPSAPGAIDYQWTQLDNGAPGVIIQNADAQMASFIPNAAGTYLFQLQVTWFCRTDIDTVSVDVMDSQTPPDALEVTELISGLSNPVQVTYAAPGDPRLFIVCKNGLIHIFENDTLSATPFLNISTVVTDSGERGLLSMAFDPDYTTNGYFYVNYTGRTPAGTGSTGDTRIVSFTRDSVNPDIADPTSAQLLLSIGQPESNHNGGQLQFGPDGYLYIGMGDGGGGGDVHGAIGNGQEPNTLLGKMLRIGVDGPNPYTIPPDNPFVGVAGTRAEIWAFGVRNPWRFSFDRLTGDLYIADVGQGQWEEIDFQPMASPGGENYGWRRMEGAHCFNPATNCNVGNLLTLPVFEYSHGLGCSVTGGFVYRGQDVPPLGGYYLFADYCSTRFWRLIFNGGIWEGETIQIFNPAGQQFTGNVIGFGEDSQGELYICTAGSGSGRVFKVTNVVDLR